MRSGFSDDYKGTDRTEGAVETRNLTSGSDRKKKLPSDKCVSARKSKVLKSAVDCGRFPSLPSVSASRH